MMAEFVQVEVTDPVVDDVDACEARLEAEFERDIDEPPLDSNYDAMCDRIVEERNFTRPCPKCHGSGCRDVSAAELERRQRKIDSSKDPIARENLRTRHARESVCPMCKGSGARQAPKRAKGIQRSPCDECFGRGQDRRGETCRTCRGAGDVVLGVMDSMFTTARCPRCRGCSEVFDENRQDVCPLCDGASCTIPVTARSTGSTKHGPPPEFSAGASEREGSSGRALSGDAAAASSFEAADRPRVVHDDGVLDAFERFSRRDPSLARALHDYRGPAGNRWDHGHPYGRIFVLWPRTPSGARLLASAPEELRRSLGSRPLEILAVMRDAVERAEPPNELHAWLVSHADEESVELLRAAREAFAEALGA
jgi:hypothetical protein